MIIARTLTAAAVLIALAGCEQPAEPASAPPAAKPEAPSAEPTGPVLTPLGLGPIRIGMSEQEGRAAVGPSRVAGDTGADFDSCKEIQLAGNLAGTWVMLEEDKVTRVSLGEGSSLKTDRGFGVGSAPAAIKAAYGDALEAEAHKYEEAPAEYLTVWTVPRERGIVYEVNGQGVVGSIHAGGPSIQYVEGCA